MKHNPFLKQGVICKLILFADKEKLKLDVFRIQDNN